MARRKMTWVEYVAHWVGPNEKQSDIVRRTGIDQATISRWLRGESRSITSQTVAKFARAYGRDVLEAFVVAGFLTEREAGIQVEAFPDPAQLTNEQLLKELQRRVGTDDSLNQPA